MVVAYGLSREPVIGHASEGVVCEGHRLTSPLYLLSLKSLIEKCKMGDFALFAPENG